MGVLFLNDWEPQTWTKFDYTMRQAENTYLGGAKPAIFLRFRATKSLISSLPSGLGPQAWHVRKGWPCYGKIAASRTTSHSQPITD